MLVYRKLLPNSLFGCRSRQFSGTHALEAQERHTWPQRELEPRPLFFKLSALTPLDYPPPTLVTRTTFSWTRWTSLLPSWFHTWDLLSVAFLAIQKWAEINLSWLIGDGSVSKAKSLQIATAVKKSPAVGCIVKMRYRSRAPDQPIKFEDLAQMLKKK